MKIHRMAELLMAQIIKEYVGYVAGRIKLENWVESAIERSRRTPEDGADE